MEHQKIHDFVIAGDVAGVEQEVSAALAAGVPASELLDGVLIPTMGEVGDLFEAGEVFVPEMLIAARAMQSALNLLRPLLVESGKEPIGKAAIGTVKGDLHDIGKNLVALMLEGAGFEIEDLGTDVLPEKFVEAAQNGAQVIGLSALLTTTMTSIDIVIRQLEEAGLRQGVKVIVGGAPVTADFARGVGADGYAPDAASAVRVVKGLLSN